jgi:leucyl-tRNA synthetase
VKDYLPSGEGQSPLAKVKKFVEVKCPKCKGRARRETDTLDTFVDSSWYFLRYTDPKNKKKFADAKRMKAWMPVSLYSGGAEHTTMHLLYSRFWHKALFDLNLVADTEPYRKRMNRGLIMGPDGQKMSKSRGNVIDPDEVVLRLGGDTVRMYLAFIGPYNEVASYPWNPDGVVGVRRFLERVFRLQGLVRADDVQELNGLLHKTLKKVGEDIEVLKFNTAISALMIFLNEAEKKKGIGERQWEMLLKMIEPFAPHISEELWSRTGHTEPLVDEEWPAYDEEFLKEDVVSIVVQVDGKMRAQIKMPAGASNEEVEKVAHEAVASRILGKKIEKTIVVPNRLINFVLEM